MKILFCTNTFETVTNGPSKFANLLLQINELKNDDEVRILTEDISHDKEFVYKLNFTCHPALTLVSQFIRMYSYYRETKRIKKEFTFDVVVYNNAIIAYLSAFDKNLKTVGMINDDNNIYCKDRFLSKNYFKHILFRQFEKKVSRRLDKVIVNSDYLKATLENAYGTEKNKVVRMYKSIEILSTKFRVRDYIQNPVEVLFVKNDFRRGGFYILIQALQSLTNYNFILHIIGVDKKYNSEIEAVAIGIHNLVIKNYNFKKQEFVFELMQKADIFCVPSLQEALGVANIEALAYGVPVVSTNVGGIPEVLDYGNNGWLTESGNVPDLANKISECIENEEERIAMSKRGLIFINRFSISDMFDNFLKILNDVVERGKSL